MRRTPILAIAAAIAVVAVAPPEADAQLSEVELDRGPTSELYIKRRPPVPEAPALPAALQELLEKKEKLAIAKRQEAIGLLREFLATNPTGASRADGLFKLAELLWEEARRIFVVRMDEYERKLEACRQRRASCKSKPKEPVLELGEAEKLYRTLLRDHPDYERTDLVLYLAGFAAREGNRHQQSLELFQRVIDEYPQSPLYGDAWMMIGEFYFANEQWEAAREAYSSILERPDAPTYDLALFKTAWCDWKLGDPDLAAKRFKRVLDLAVEAERSGSARTRRRRAQLRDEALEYLVIVFTEDRSISAKEVYEFLASIGGERYSQDVLVKVADAYLGQSEFDRATDTWKFLIELSPDGINAAKHQRAIVEAWITALEPKTAIAEMKVLVDQYGPGSEWAKANAGRPDAVTRSQKLTERLVRISAVNFHAEAQAVEKASNGKADLGLYGNAADTYGYYLARYGDHPNAARVRYLRAEILYWKMRKYEEAGDEYLAVGKSAPVGEFHEDALLKAIDAYEKARPPIDAGRKELTDVDRKFAEAIDLYATLFPASEELVAIIYKNGQLFYDYKEYDEAIKRFGLIVTKYPDSDEAGPAGDRILKALVAGEDYETIEEWARKLKDAKAFQSKDQQARLDRLIVESIGKSGEKYADAGKYARAANFYLRVPKEFPKHELAAPSLMNAGVMLEKARRMDAAAQVYLRVPVEYPKHRDAAKAAFTAAKVYEGVAYFDRAAEAYEVVVAKYPRSKYGADAQFNAGLLRQALGQYRRAIEHYQRYSRQYRGRKDAASVAFNIGVVYEEAGDDGRAERAYKDYLRRFGRKGRVVEAHTRAGRAALRLGHTRRAAASLKTALRTFEKLRKDKAAALPWAAEARYHEGELVFRRFAAISLDVKPRRLRRTLDRKTKLLENAQQVYLDVVDMGDLQWATAALYRIARVYDEFAEAIREAPVPPGLPKADAELYKQELEMYVIDIEERAIELYATGYAKALELQVYNKYTSMIREALGRLNSDQFPPERESRPKTRFGDRPIEPEIVQEVIRGGK